MTPQEQRIAWYQEQAQRNGVSCAQMVDERLEGFAVDHARLAGHFGRLALGETVLYEKDEHGILGKVA